MVAMSYVHMDEEGDIEREPYRPRYVGPHRAIEGTSCVVCVECEDCDDESA